MMPGSAKCEPEIEPDRLVDDLWRKAVAAIADFLHPLGYRTAGGTASPERRDNAVHQASAINGYRSATTIHAAATVYATATVNTTAMVHAAAVHAAAIHAATIYAASVTDRGVSRDVGPAASIGTPVKAQATSSRDQRHIGALVRNR
jgi:hypothetical protein